MALLLAGTAAAPLAQAKNSLRCTVKDQAGNPLPKIEMVLTPIGNGKEKKEKTNDGGVVQFKGLDDGSYELRGNVDGYLFATSAPIELSGNAVKSCEHVLPSAEYFDGLLQAALESVRQRKFAVAEEKGKEALNLSPQEAAAHYVLAVAYATQGKESEAVSAAKKAAELNPEKFESLVTPVHIAAFDANASQAMTNKDFDGAIKKYEEMLEAFPGEASAYYGMALAYGHKENFEQALKAIDKAIEMKPDELEFKQMKIRLQDLYLKSMDEALELKK